MSQIIQAVPLDQFDRDQRVRLKLNPDLVQQIAQSFRTVGQLQPVRARRKERRFAMVDGHHRLEAAFLAAKTSLDTIVEEGDLDDGEILKHQLIMNCQREDVAPLERARGIQELMRTCGLTANQAADLLGFSNATVTRQLKLLTLPPPILDQIGAGNIPASAAYELSFIDDPAKQTELAEQLAKGELTRDALIGARKAAARKPAAKKSGRSSRATARLSGGSEVSVSCAGLTLERFIEVVEELLGKARRVRTQGVELSTFIKMLRDQARAD